MKTAFSMLDEEKKNPWIELIKWGPLIILFYAAMGIAYFIACLPLLIIAAVLLSFL